VGLALAVFSVLAAGFHCGGPVQVTLGEPFELRPGEKAAVAGGDVVLTFLSVPEDSRCPKGEQCITAGNARVTLEAVPREGEATRFDLNTARGSTEMNVSGFLVSILGLDPYPVSGRPISSQEYLVKLTVHRL
jgi:hypothetical protein